MSDTEIIELPDGRMRKQDKGGGKIHWTQKANKKQKERIRKGKEVEVVPKNYHLLRDKDGLEVWIHRDMVVKCYHPNGKLVNVAAGVDPAHLPRKLWHYSKQLASHICDLLAKGQTIKKICSEEGMPGRDVIYKWMREYNEFKLAVNEARALRADYYADEIIETAEEVDDDGKFAIEKAKLKVKAYEWSARKDNPERYDAKASAKPQGPAKIIINTGVDDGKTSIKIDGKES